MNKKKFIKKENVNMFFLCPYYHQSKRSGIYIPIMVACIAFFGVIVGTVLDAVLKPLAERFIEQKYKEPPDKEPLYFNDICPSNEFLDIKHLGNTIIINGIASTGSSGFYLMFNDIDLKGRTVMLEMKNYEGSKFLNLCLIKITENKEPSIVTPKGYTALIWDEYIPKPYTKPIEFTLANDFDGKLDFVFTDVDLIDLQLILHLINE